VLAHRLYTVLAASSSEVNESYYENLLEVFLKWCAI